MWNVGSQDHEQSGALPSLVYSLLTKGSVEPLIQELSFSLGCEV